MMIMNIRKQSTFYTVLIALILMPLSLFARSGDGDYLEIEIEDNWYYDDYQWSGYRESLFEAAAKEYINQDLKEVALVNFGIMILDLAESDMFLIARVIGDKRLEANVPKELRKALLMSLARGNITYGSDIFSAGSEYWGAFMFKAAIKYRYLLYDARLDGISFNRMYYSLKSINRVLREKNYEIELTSILNKIYDDFPKEMMADTSLDGIKNRSFRDNIAKGYQSLDERQLVEMFDFLKGAWNSPLTILAGKDGFEVPLSLEKSRAFIMALSRLRLTASHLYPISVSVDDSKDTSFMQQLSGWCIGFRCDFQGLGIIEFSLQNNANGIVWVKNLGKEGVKNKPLIKNGKYYSPELYNIMISVFGEISRKRFLESPDN